MTENNKNKTAWYVYQPLIYLTFIIFGIYIGVFIIPGNYNIKSSNANKISNVLSIIEDNYVDTINEKQLIESSIESILSSLDPHSQFISAEDLKASNELLEGNFEGIGIQFNIQNDTIVVINTITAGPSEKKGIMAGDRIIIVDNKVVAGIKIESKDVMKLLKGKKGSEVNISIKRKGLPKLINFTITRDVIPTYSIEISFMTNKNTGYIKISQFSSTTIDEFDKATQKLLNLGMQNLILDLRGNAGGFLTAAVYISNILHSTTPCHIA